MIIGSFRERWRPHIMARLVMPRLSVDVDVRFQIDTGSDITLLHPTDLHRAGIEVEQLEGESGTEGIGGFAGAFREPAVLHFRDADGTTRYSYRFNLEIARPDTYNADYPSLLGMDILSCWYTECDPTNDILQFTVRRII